VEIGPLTVLFAGHIDNAGWAAAELGLSAPAPGDLQALARLYGAALIRWQEAADLRLVGEYAAISLDPQAQRLRLARSPLRAPPLHYHVDDARVMASTAVRALHGCGIERKADLQKLADAAWFNYSDEARGWFKGIARVPLGAVVEFTPGAQDTRHYYDTAAIAQQPAMPLADRLAAAHDLLAEATRAALTGSKRPALMLSGGLDSPLIAVKALAALPPQARLNGYTFVPEPDWRAYPMPGRFTDERPYVEGFCARHPRIDPHFFDNSDTLLDTRLTELFHASGVAPQGLANLTVYHALWKAARDDGCDRVLLGEFGNLTASADGSWAYSEYLLTLRWRQLWLGLRNAPGERRSLLRKFMALAIFPLLPDRLWHWQRRLRGVHGPYHLASPLRADYAESAGVIRRGKAVGLPESRFPVRDRLALLNEVHSNAWGEFSDTYYGFEEIYRIQQRDPFAYRPFVEFCAGLPSDTFLRDGQDRWLAREMLRGHMPEPQRLERRTGRHQADWHAKLGRQRQSLRQELDRHAGDPDLAAMFDFERLRDALEDWPETGDIPEDQRMLREIALPRALIMSRFVAWAEGRNLGP
jgi:asparagine synthase (glutamine-hydrolysing)